MSSLRRGVEKWWHRLHPSAKQKLSLPDFLGIGAQKAGTTWLHENLKCHPDVFVPDRKELHYFDLNFNNTLRSYAAEFQPERQH